MKQLTEYAKNGYDFKVTKREKNFAIALGKSRTSKSESWEVFEVQSHNGLNIAGVAIPPAEFPPRNEQWGSKGWTALSENRAHEIFNEQLACLPH